MLIYTNYHYREITYYEELPEEIQAECIEDKDLDYCASYIKYKNEWYCLDDFMVIEVHPQLKSLENSWDGYLALLGNCPRWTKKRIPTAPHEWGLLVRYSRNLAWPRNEWVQIATYWLTEGDLNGN